MRFKTWALGLTLAGTALLSACGGGGDGDNSTSIRLLNATRSYSTLDLAVDDKSVNSNVSYAAVGSYASVSTTDTAAQVQTSGVGTTVAALTLGLSADSNYTLIAYGWSGAVRTSLLQEAEEAPASGKSKLLVLNLAPDAGALDVFLSVVGDSVDNESAVATAVAGGSSSGYKTINSGSFRVRITGTGKKADLRLDIPSISLSSAGVSTLIITANEGGVLVNGILLAQQGSTTNFASTESRARVVAAVADSATVSALLNGNTLLGTSVAPTIGEYQSFAAGTGTLSVLVNGNPLVVSAPTLKAGADYTLLVWGDTASPQLTVISDDNRLPSTAGTVKMRLVNGVASLNTGLTLSLDYSAIATNVTPGTASTPAVISASTSSLLSVSSPTSGTPVYEIAELPLVANGIYSVFLLGGADKMVGTLRRER